MKWNREQYLALMTGHRPERQMFCEIFGLLVGLDEEWKAQGASDGELDLTEFCFDYLPSAPAGAATGYFGAHEDTVLDDNDSYIITRDYLGRTMKLFKKSGTIALPLDYPVADMDSWLKIKPFFEYTDERFNRGQAELAAKLKAEGSLITASIPGGFDLPRQLMGEEMACFAAYDCPELLDDILGTVAETARRVFEKVCEVVVPDVLGVHEDMAGKSGPLFGPAQVERFIKPYYTGVWEVLRKKGTPLFSQDSDGNMNGVMDAFVGCGVNAFYPMEPAAGMDMVKLRHKYGLSIAFTGGIDKHVIRGSRGDIRRELEYKLSPPMLEGGCVFSLDHRIPNGTPLANYRYYVDTAREMLGLPPRSAAERGWGRIAF